MASILDLVDLYTGPFEIGTDPAATPAAGADPVPRQLLLPAESLGGLRGPWFRWGVVGGAGGRFLHLRTRHHRRPPQPHQPPLCEPGHARGPRQPLFAVPNR